MHDGSSVLASTSRNELNRCINVKCTSYFWDRPRRKYSKHIEFAVIDKFSSDKNLH